ncbi:MAG TPA: cyclic nucleotide-binding domain-containing protein [Methylomirabilota bacterium]|nr:cyclic nucleotide-binding domain-containing protein [Methylomirabilota bacterium]
MPPALIRKALPADAPRWIELLNASVGAEYPDKGLYDPAWVEGQFAPDSGAETWVAEQGGKILSSISFLAPFQGPNPVANMGRHLNRPEAFNDGTAEALLKRIGEIAEQRKQLVVNRVIAADSKSQILHERAGYVCVGFQPYKHMLRTREGALFYVRPPQSTEMPRLPLSESLPQVADLAKVVLPKLKLTAPPSVRDGVTGYALQNDARIVEGSTEDFQKRKEEANAANPPLEISGMFHQGQGFLRGTPGPAPKALIAERDGNVTAGLLYNFDTVDRCVRVVDGFCSDDLSIGVLLRQATRAAQEQNAVYVEVDILSTAPRLLKSAEQLGFVPIAYMPAFVSQGDTNSDVIKLIKLNMVYSPEETNFTSMARGIAETVDQNFQDQKVGVAIINLLRGLPFLEGLGDGELRKVARLFTQKLFRPGEKIFGKGDQGNEAYVIMRGQIDIIIEENTKPIASFGIGQIFGELAFLDGAPRTAIAVASQPSILLVLARSSFNSLVQHEPHLGMVVMRNMAIELSNRLRKMTAKK